MSTEQQPSLETAIDRYCDDCQSRIDSFVSRHLQGAGSRRLNRQAFGWDLLRVPLNIAWAPFWLLLQLLGQLLRLCGWPRACDFIGRLPVGFSTRLQRHLTGLIEKELLDISPKEPDPLLRYMADVAGIDEVVWQQALEGNVLQSQSQQLKARLFGARTAIAELSSSLGMAAFGAVAFKQFTPGALGGGAALASWWAWENAVRDFWLGERLGRVWYGWFPPEVDWGARIIATLLLIVILALAASMSGFVTDPLQAKLGLHQRRLNKLVDKLREELKQQLVGNVSSREQYLARLADVADWVTIAASKAS